MNSNALCIFIKAPRLGQVKTRLQPGLSQKNTLQLYKAMVEDLLSRLKVLNDIDSYLFFWPENARDEIHEWLGKTWTILPQSGRNLGEKMDHAIQWAINCGYDKSLIIGSDIPELNDRHIMQALSDLESNDAVVGPCKDGGYYLIGLKEPQPELFYNMIWSTHHVYQLTIERLKNHNLSWSSLPILRDLDQFNDVQQFWYQLQTATSDIQKKHLNTYKILNHLLSDS